MPIGVSFQTYDGGPVVAATQADRADLAVGSIAYVDAMGPGGYTVTDDTTNRPLGVVTRLSRHPDEPLQVQTDGTLTLTGLDAETRAEALAVGNSIAWTNAGTLLTDPAHPIGYILHATATTVRVQLTHSP